MSEHKEVTGIGYVGTFIGLLVLATISLLISFLHLPVWGTVISLGIAVVKALLVAFFFMGLAEQRFTNRATVLASVFFVSLLVGLMAADVATRHTLAARVEPAPSEAFYGR